ncbi:glycolipid transfer protein [Ramicandelaber brevisporus]|nr:glycolipid transfer protein [Ramicandelaber brevisporus]
MSTGYFLDTIDRSFTDVHLTGPEQHIDTREFLEAAQAVVQMFEILGATAFLAVIKDMNGNIAKIRTKYLTSPTTLDSLQKIILAEKAEKTTTATQGLLWLKRGLEFTCKALRHNVANPTVELDTSFNTAYGETLRNYHNFIIRGVFAVAMKACPTRAYFYEKLGPDYATVEKQLVEWLAALENIIAILNAFYASGNYDKGL